MDEDKQVLSLIGDIYDAAIDRGLWPTLLEHTCQYVGGHCSALMAESFADVSSKFYFHWGFDPHSIQLYNDVYIKLSPVLTPTLLYGKTGDILSTADLMPYDEFLASRFYKEWAAPLGLVDALAAILEKSVTSYGILAVQLHERNGIANAEHKHRLGLLAPHFRRAVAIGRIIDLHKVEAASFGDTLDGLASAMVMVDANARIVHANVAGQAMLADGAVLRRAGDKLAAVDPTAQLSLRDVFAAATVGDSGVGTQGIAIPMPSGDGEQWVAHVLPLTSQERRKAGANYSAVAAVFVRKAALDLPHPMATVAARYKLTPAETRVMMAIIEIGGMSEVAPILGISEGTVKTHLLRVFKKTGTSRQADLVKLVAGFASPLGGRPPTS